MQSDRLTKKQPNKNMQAVKASGSKIENRLQKALWKKGYRYRKNYKQVFGKPDIVFMSLKIAVFCDSEFWHGYDWENRKNDFKSNKDFWIKKIQRNIERDYKVNQKLEKDGWIVIRIWGNDIKNNLENCIAIIEAASDFRKSK